MSDSNTISKNANILFQEKFFPSPARSVSFFLLDQVGLSHTLLHVIDHSRVTTLYKEGVKTRLRNTFHFKQ